MIEFSNVSKKYRTRKRRAGSIKDIFSFGRLARAGHSQISTFTAVNNVSFHINESDSVGILGRNGAGKSTILKLMTKIILPTSGFIRINGTFSTLLEVGAGFHHDLSGYENIFLSGAILGMNRKTVKQSLDEIIAFSEIGDFIDSPVKHYSSGMFLRLAFSIGVHLKSDILVIDEAISVGDSNFQNKCLHKINEIKKNKKTVVFVSHDLNQVSAICNKAILIEQGNVIFDGDVDDAIKIYTSC
ncbi:MAG: ABC transporter ATP-binding protein [Sodalis sp. (in: enterobacteria)]|uniref:ABC transporter ATP-binding protein n=1 Tax=Sodalis sp. (in: enterobacteria) TaxID=1898979 RepID=UPI003F39B100